MQAHKGPRAKKGPHQVVPQYNHPKSPPPDIWPKKMFDIWPKKCLWQKNKNKQKMTFYDQNKRVTFRPKTKKQERIYGKPREI